jgi:hypothetical protein
MSFLALRQNEKKYSSQRTIQKYLTRVKRAEIELTFIDALSYFKPQEVIFISNKGFLIFQNCWKLMMKNNFCFHLKHYYQFSIIYKQIFFRMVNIPSYLINAALKQMEVFIFFHQNDVQTDGNRKVKNLFQNKNIQEYPIKYLICSKTFSHYVTMNLRKLFILISSGVQKI